MIKKEICGGCGAIEGKLHNQDCDLEKCQLCNTQIIFCTCKKKDRQKARVPFIQYPLICAKCGRLWPDFFMVDNKEWEFYVQPNMRNKIICHECYEFIKEVTDGGTHTLPGFKWVNFKVEKNNSKN